MNKRIYLELTKNLNMIKDDSGLDNMFVMSKIKFDDLIKLIWLEFPFFLY